MIGLVLAQALGDVFVSCKHKIVCQVCLVSHRSFFRFNPQQQLYKESAEKSHLTSQAHPILTDVAGTYGFRDLKLKHKVSWHWYGSNPKQTLKHQTVACHTS